MSEQQILISDPEKLEQTIEKMRADGPEKLHILADFDKTLTRAVVDGQASPSVIAQLRNNKILEQTNYAEQAHALFNKYYTYETDQQLSFAERSEQMKKWWHEHHELLIKCGLDQESINAVVAKKTLQLRTGTLNFVDILHNNNIPLVIMSAAPAYMIARYLAQEDRLYDNIKIIGNWYIFDANGKMIGVEEPIIHVLNKREITLGDKPEFAEIKKRRNVIVLGDTLEDTDMITGFDYDQLIKIGFYNQPTDENLDKYRETFDIVITGDGNMNYVNELLQKIIS